VDCIRSFAGEPVNVNDVMSWLSFDIMGEVTFGEDFGIMENKEVIDELVHQRKALALVAPLVDAPWISQLGFKLFPFLGPVRGWWAALRVSSDRMERRMAVRP
jgi:hypothetical protein